MKPIFLILGLSLLSLRCLSQTITHKEQAWLISRFSTTKVEISNHNIDTLLSSGAYWALFATYNGKEIQTKDDVANRSFKFVIDGRLLEADDYDENPANIFSGRWSFNKMTNQLIITSGAKTKKIYQVIRLTQYEMLIEDKSGVKSYFMKSDNYDTAPQALRYRVFFDHL